MPKRPVLDLNKPKLFKPSITKGRRLPKASVKNLRLSDAADTAIQHTASFRYDGPNSGIKSTQQIGVDFSKFENHTFFNSAQAKVNVAFDTIINRFPFDGTRSEVEVFLDSLTGFEKYVYDHFPKSKGYLNFSGSQVGEHSGKGTYIEIVDSAGTNYPNLSKNSTGETIIDPKGERSLSFEFHLLVPSQSNDNQIICQRMSSPNHGITLAISSSDSPNSCSIMFSAVSSSHYMSASVWVEKGKFNYLYAALDRTYTKQKLALDLNNKLFVTSSDRAKILDMGFLDSRFTIGSGTAVNMDGSVASSVFTPMQTMSGSLDDFRMYHKIVSKKDRERFEKRPVYASNDLKLYYKFNEPTGSIGPDSIVLDSSGNSLHTVISNYSHTCRSTGSFLSPMEFEDISLSPVLFPAYVGVKNLNSLLLASGSGYDKQNPNLITKLIPPHYFEEGQVFHGFDCEDGTLMKTLTDTSIPGSHTMGTAQLLTYFLFIWAKYFDEMKLFNDQFANLLSMDYETIDTTPDQFLQFYASYFGFELPNLFKNATMDQYIRGEDCLVDHADTVPLAQIQNKIWRRILVNLQEIILSKGTVHGIKSLIRAMGINPDNNFRIREYGGPIRRTIKDLREKKTEVSTVIDFSGSLSSQTKAAPDTRGISRHSPFITSPFLSSSRVEVGYPEPAGVFKYGNNVNPTKYGIHGVSNNRSDGLLTSGSFTFEGSYHFPLTRRKMSVTQSLGRLQTTGSYSGFNKGPGIVANLIAISSSFPVSSSIKLVASPSSMPSSPILEMFMTGVNIFDGNVWNVSFGRQRSDDLDKCSFLTSSYFLRCARQNFGELVDVYHTSSMFIEHSGSENTVWQNITPSYNASGSFIAIGSQSFEKTDILLNSTGSPEIGRSSRFDGNLTQLRMWSKALDIYEWREHILNFKSVGVEDPRTNFNFHTHRTGAFSRLRVDVSTDQHLTKSDSDGKIVLTDFSQNDFHCDGFGFEHSTRVIKPKTFYYSHLTPKFDILQTDNKVRIRSLYNPDSLKDPYYTLPAPLYEIPKSEEPTDDARFSIDISSVMALDEDIMNIFSTLDFFDNAMGQTNNMFVEDYPEIVQARKVYFNRLLHKINLKHFFEFFKWFDTGMGSIIKDLVPKKTNYFGINFVIESHVLERNKFIYHYLQIHRAQKDKEYLDQQPNDPNLPNQNQFFGRLKKY